MIDGYQGFRKTDRFYYQSVENGDLLTYREMVDEAAELYDMSDDTNAVGLGDYYVLTDIPVDKVPGVGPYEDVETGDIFTPEELEMLYRLLCRYGRIEHTSFTGWLRSAASKDGFLRPVRRST